MPTILVWRGFKFRLYASDGLEPPHVNIVKDAASAKVWLRNLEVGYQYGYNEREMRELLTVIAEHRDEWIGAWNEFFGI